MGDFIRSQINGIIRDAPSLGLLFGTNLARRINSDNINNMQEKYSAKSIGLRHMEHSAINFV